MFFQVSSFILYVFIGIDFAKSIYIFLYLEVETLVDHFRSRSLRLCTWPQSSHWVFIVHSLHLEAYNLTVIPITQLRDDSVSFLSNYNHVIMLHDL